jgi:hypothetical protein
VRCEALFEQYAPAVNAAARPTPSLQRVWWLRALSVLQSPRSAFAALRDDSDEAADARQEPLLAIMLLAGFAGVLATSFAGTILDDPAFDNSTFAVLAWAFLGGLVYALLVFWLGGLMVFAVATAFNARASYRQSRHVVALAAAPLALTLLLVWPLRLAIYGGDVFRSGGSDTGAGDVIFDVLVLASYAWGFALVGLGIRELKRSSSLSGIW